MKEGGDPISHEICEKRKTKLEEEMVDPKILELRRWSVEDLMGFQLMTYKQAGFESSNISPNKDKLAWFYPDGEYEDGSQAWEFYCWEDMLGEIWNPDDEKTGQIWMIVRKMREALPDGSDGFNFNLNWQAHKGITISIAQFHKIDPWIHGQGANDNPCVATLMAAREAWTQWVTSSYRKTK